MEWLTATGTIVGIVIAIGGIVGAIVYVKATVKTAEIGGSDKIANQALTNLQVTVSALKTQNDLQAGQIATGIDERLEQSKKIASLEGTVDTLKNIPLGKIEKHMADANAILTALLPLIPKTITEDTTIKTIHTTTQ